MSSMLSIEPFFRSPAMPVFSESAVHPAPDWYARYEISKEDEATGSFKVTGSFALGASSWDDTPTSEEESISSSPEAVFSFSSAKAPKGKIATERTSAKVRQTPADTLNEKALTLVEIILQGILSIVASVDWIAVFYPNGDSPNSHAT